MSYAIRCSLVVLVVVGLVLGLAYTSSEIEADTSDYDANGNGVFEKDEVLAVIVDYFRDRITKEEVLEVLILYFLSDAKPEPTSTSTQNRTPSDTEELRPRDQWTAEFPATREEIQSELHKYQGSTLTFVTWGDAHSIAQVQPYISLFSEQFSIEIVTETMDYAELKTQVETHNVLWQVLGYGGQATWKAAADGLLEGLDFGIVGAQASLESDRSPYFICWTCGHMIDADSWSIPRGLKAQDPYSFELASLFIAWTSGMQGLPHTPIPALTPGLATEDLTAPELVEVTLDRSNVDTTEEAGTVKVTVRARDDLSGVSSVYMRFGSSSGKQSNRWQVHQPISGSRWNGTYEYKMTLPQFSETGMWQLESAGVYDEVWND